jgi:hypothetical protein
VRFIPLSIAILNDVIRCSLFLLPTSDDLSHDEALSSRIAALNMLDLGLEHLDVNIGNAAEKELDAVVKACGESMLTILDCGVLLTSLIICSTRTIRCQVPQSS